MSLSAFGVESDNFPSIEGYIDFVKDSSTCEKTYYNPAFKPSTYRLSTTEIKKVLQLLKASDLEKLKLEYKVSKTDQPTSTTTIYAGQRIFVIKDYGLEGDPPLTDLYKIVYKY
jgi:predicted RNA-binding protein with PUA-like domain